MKTFDFEEFCRRLNLVMIIYDKKLAPEVLTIYFDALKNFELSQIVVALAQYTQDAEKGMFAPKPADIFRLIGGTQTDQANVAWGQLYRAISEIGAYQDVIFDDACIHAAVRDLGGWTHICESDYDQISFIQNKFIKIYTAYKNQVDFKYPKKLVGYRSTDSDYVRQGLQIPSPKYFGDERRAREVEKIAAENLGVFSSVSQLADEATKNLLFQEFGF